MAMMIKALLLNYRTTASTIKKLNMILLKYMAIIRILHKVLRRKLSSLKDIKSIRILTKNLDKIVV